MSKENTPVALAKARFEGAWKAVLAQVAEVVLTQMAAYAAEEFRTWVSSR